MDYSVLLKYATSEAQRRVILAVMKYGTRLSASKALGCSERNVYSRIASAKVAAEKAGVCFEEKKDEFKGEVVGIIGDTHLPYELSLYLDWIQVVFQKNGVTKVIHIGDLIDHHALSFHDSEPALKGAYGEYIDALKHLEPWKKAFPNMTLIHGNHDRIPARQIKKLGINPVRWMRPLSEVYDFPSGWCEVEDIEIDGVLYHHGETAMGVNGFRNDAKNRMQNTVSGHSHGNLGISYTASHHRLVWGMAVGCGIDNSKMAFAYGKHFKHKPIIGCGVVRYGKDPQVFAMDLGEH